MFMCSLSRQVSSQNLHFKSHFAKLSFNELLFLSLLVQVMQVIGISQTNKQKKDVFPNK